MRGPVKGRRRARLLALMLALAIALLVAIAWLAPTGSRAATGVGEGLVLADDALAYIPSSAPKDRPAPLLVLLHGASGRPATIIRPFLDDAEAQGIVLVAPASRAYTWDEIAAERQPQASHNSFRPRVRAPNRDPPRIRAAVAAVAEHVQVDAARTALAGFSDGASYALMLGARDPQRFPTLIAFSPGMALAGGRSPQRIFIALGRNDRVLPFDTASSIVRRLRRGPGEVRFVPFDGGHEMPEAVQAGAIAFFLKGGARH
jgi:phospholipase/carboxylesterase